MEKTIEKKQLYALNALRLISILLVFHSHSGPLYPAEALANGGAVGNALFFIISGYLIKTKGSFLPWIWNKFVRLYPQAVIVSAVYVLMYYPVPLPAREFCTQFCNRLVGFWFVGAIFCFCALIYVLDRLNVFDHFAVYSVIIWAAYVVCYILFVDKSQWSVENKSFFRWIYYFYIYSLGFCLKKGVIRRSKRPYKRLLAVALGCFVLSLGIKLLMSKISVLMYIQFTVQIAGMIVAILALNAVLSAEEDYRSRFSEKTIGVINFLSRMSFEIYLSQRLYIRYFQRFPFPVGWLCTIAATFVTAFLLNLLAGKLSKHLTYKMKERSTEKQKAQG